MRFVFNKIWDLCTKIFSSRASRFNIERANTQNIVWDSNMCPTLKGPVPQASQRNPNRFQVNIDQGWPRTLLTLGRSSDYIRTFNHLQHAKLHAHAELFQPILSITQNVQGVTAISMAQQSKHEHYFSSTTRSPTPPFWGQKIQPPDTRCQIRADLAPEGTSISLKRGNLCLASTKYMVLRELLLELLLLLKEKKLSFL